METSVEDSTMNIGAAARASGLPPKTIRFYEEIGLVAAERRANGYRSYGPGQVRKLRFVQRARGLGFSVEDCRNLLSLYEDRNRASADVRALATERLKQIETKLAELQSLHAELSHLIDSCQGGSRPDCPILEDLAGQAQAGEDFGAKA